MIAGRPITICAWVAVSLVATGGCASKEKYEKRTGTLGDSASVNEETSLHLPKGEAAWVRELTEEGKAAQLAVDLGNPQRGLDKADSLLAVAEAAMDSVAHGSSSEKFLVMFLTDMSMQAIHWDKARGNSKGSAERTQRFRELAERLHRRRKAADSLPPGPM